MVIEEYVFKPLHAQYILSACKVTEIFSHKQIYFLFFGGIGLFYELCMKIGITAALLLLIIPLFETLIEFAAGKGLCPLTDIGRVVLEMDGNRATPLPFLGF